MNTCGTCKYRGEPIQPEDWDNGGKRAETTYFLCDRIKHDDRWSYMRNQGAVVVDGSGYYAVLCVEDDFGCNKWEAK